MTVQDIDLGFRPAPERDGKRLRADQIAHYNERGFVQPFDVFGAREIARIRAYFDRLMADLGEAGDYGINCYQARMAGIWDIATDPRILDHVEDIVGPDIVCWASAILSKKPGRRARGAVASGCEFLEAHPRADGDRLARHRRRGRGKRGHALHRRHP